MLPVPLFVAIALSQAPEPPSQSTLERLDRLERELEELRLQLPEEMTATVVPTSPPPPNVFNPLITVFGSVFYRYDDEPLYAEETTQRIDNTVSLREVEIDFRAPVDPFADAVVTAAFGAETPGEFEAVIEEGYVVIKRWPVPLLETPPLGLRLKTGRFRAALGRANVLHTHDLPQSTRPLAVAMFLGEEGYAVDGVSTEWSLPMPAESNLAVDLTLQAFSGGHLPLADDERPHPGFVVNLRLFAALANGHELDVSAIGHTGQIDARHRAVTYGGEILYRWRPARMGTSRSFLLGGQFLASRRALREPFDADGDGTVDGMRETSETPWGYYAFTQLQLSRGLYVGARWDQATALEAVDDSHRALTGYLSVYASEFLRLRLSYEQRGSTVAGADRHHTAMAELHFVIGSHPVEPYWVNR